MKQILVILMLCVAVNCKVQLPEVFRTAKDISERPETKTRLEANFPPILAQSDASDKSPFIVGGRRANMGEIPHQVVLIIVEGPYAYICGGSLINSKWVLTAAHCVDFAFSLIQVGGGITDLNLGAEFVTNVTSRSHVHMHPNYDDTYLFNDIALIYLQNAPSNILSSPNVKAVGLAASQQQTTGFNGTVSGFGNYATGSPNSQYLKVVTLPIVDNAVCRAVYGAAVLETNICLSTTLTESPCSGDSGGPLTISYASNTTLVGVVSFGHRAGCELGHPAGFTRVSSYLNWINEISMSPKSIILNSVLFIVAQLFLLM